MPRTSAAALATPVIDVRKTRLAAPDDLSEPARRVWIDLVNSLAPEHFAKSDAPLLRSYCEATALADLAATELAANGPVVNGKASPWLTVQEKQVRAQTALSLRLRLSPQSRFSRDKAGTNSNPRRTGSALYLKPWDPPLAIPDEIEVEDDDETE